MENDTETASQHSYSARSSLSIAVITFVVVSVLTIFILIAACLVQRFRCCGVHLLRSRLPETENEEDGNCSTVTREIDDNIFTISNLNEEDRHGRSESPPTYSSLVIMESACPEVRWEISLEEDDARQDFSTESRLPSYDEVILAKFDDG